jgi:hypothetical protein
VNYLILTGEDDFSAGEFGLNSIYQVATQCSGLKTSEQPAAASSSSSKSSVESTGRNILEVCDADFCLTTVVSSLRNAQDGIDAEAVVLLNKLSEIFVLELGLKSWIHCEQEAKVSLEVFRHHFRIILRS